MKATTLTMRVDPILKEQAEALCAEIHGVLFRGAAEGTIRKHLLENGSIYAVISLPAGIFFNTGIPTCIIILKKNNTDRSILFIDASKEFRKEKARNCMDAEHINKIVNTYTERKDVDKFAHLASFEEIKKNDFNLNIPRYVDTSEPEVDLSVVSAQIADLDAEIQKGVDKLLPLAQDITVTVNDEASKKMLADVIRMLQEV